MTTENGLRVSLAAKRTMLECETHPRSCKEPFSVLSIVWRGSSDDLEREDRISTPSTLLLEPLCSLVTESCGERTLPEASKRCECRSKSMSIVSSSNVKSGKNEGSSCRSSCSGLFGGQLWCKVSVESYIPCGAGSLKV